MTVGVNHLYFTVLALDTWLPVAPAAVWPFVSQPDQINRWSKAPVRGLETGDGGRLDTVGTLREVELPRPLSPVTEVVQRADAPSRFVYRAVGSRAVRYHRGEITLAPQPPGTRLRWEVGIALPVLGGAAMVHRLLRPSLSDSLTRLVALVDGVPETPLPAEALHDEADPALLAAASSTGQAQRVLADDMQARGDARHWFSRVYQYVTEEMVDACGRGEVAHPAWALRLIPRFHEFYVRSVHGDPERHWREAFDAIETAGTETASAALPFWSALVAGARAHIEGDLPRVLAAVYDQHYRHRCDYARFRADFMLLAAPLGRAWQRLSAEVPSRWFPPYLRAASRLLPTEAVEHLTAKRFYDPLAARREAFERGGELASNPSASSPAAEPESAGA